MKYFLSLIAIVGIACASFAEQVPTPGAAQSEPMVLLGGTAHLGNGEVQENSAIFFENGLITNIADARTIRINPDEVKVIDVTGKHVYPGLIAPTTTLGLVEIGAVRATRDQTETGTWNPNVRASIAYNTDSRVIPTIRSNGILLAQIVPQGGRVSGSSSIMQLDAWNWEDAVVKESDGLWMSWPNMVRRTGWWGDPGPLEKNEKYDEQIAEIKDFLLEARAYSADANPATKNIKFEAMRGLFDKSRKLYIRVNGEKEIMSVISLRESMDLDIVIVGGRDAWMITDLIKKYDIPIILQATHRLPSAEDEDIDQPFKTAQILHEAGIRFCFSMNGSWNVRNLPFQAGTAVAYGLDPEVAVSALTKTSAEILGLDGYGEIAIGKSATLAVSEGDILDMRTSVITHAFIDGRTLDLSDIQKDLNEKFREKYGLE